MPPALVQSPLAPLTKSVIWDAWTELMTAVVEINTAWKRGDDLKDLEPALRELENGIHLLRDAVIEMTAQGAPDPSHG